MKLNFVCQDSEAVESAQHLFHSYSTFGSLWLLARSWIGFSLVDSPNISGHYFSLLIYQEALERGGPFCNSSG
jgi:hypothetical protein